MTIKVIHVIHWPKSGIVSLLKNMLPFFNKKKFSQHVIFFEQDKETMEDFAEIVDSVHCLNLSKSRLKGLMAYRNILKTLSPDILHTHSFQPDFWGTLLSQSGIKSVCTVHNDYPHFYENSIRSIFKRTLNKLALGMRTKKVVAVSREVKNALSKLICEKGILVIENGVPTDLIAALVSKKKRLQKLRLVTLGRLSHQKGYDILLKAFQNVLAYSPEVHLVIIGDGPERNCLVDLANKLGVLQKVIFTGWLSEPLSELAKADSIYVCSSRYEGFGLSILEAMALGIPVVSTLIGGFPALLTHKETGFLVTPENSNELADMILEAISDKDIRKQVAKNGQKFIAKYFDIKRTVNQYELLYKGLIADEQL